MQLTKKGFFPRLCFLASFVLAGIPIRVVAQAIPDGTLPSTVQQLQEIMRINGGERAGNNLFHSFEEFSVGEGIEAVFDNAVDIENIFTRITGDTASNINGILRTQGGANLFLVNPNGIVFGENAKLDIGGSFVATTADSIRFEDGVNFAASGSEPEAILTVSIPIGLGLGANPGDITVNGNGSPLNRAGDLLSQAAPFNRDNGTANISVKPGNTLALVGGNINIRGGSLAVSSGRIELGSVNSGEVSLAGFTLGYETELSFGQIEFSENSSADVSGTEEGSILLTGSNISLEEGSVLLNQSTSNTSSGTIQVDAAESLTISGAAQNTTPSSIVTETLGDGKAANISISAQNLQLENSGNINSSTFGAGETGSISIEVLNSIQLSRTSQEDTEILPSDMTLPSFGISPSSITTSSIGEGNADDISLSATSYLSSGGSRILSSSVGSGNTGNINIDTDSIEIDGATERNNIFGGFIGSSTLGRGNAGSINIATDFLRVSNGGSITADSIADGNAGNITIEVSDRIEIIGRDPNPDRDVPSNITSSVDVEPIEQIRTLLGAPLMPAGNGGTISISSPNLNILQGGAISVRNEGTGSGGTISINANELNLEEAGTINAATASGSGGNVELNTENIQIDEESLVTATAENNGDGGNITIQTTSLIGKKNSQITANAFGGRGGNIDVNAEGLFLFDSVENIFSASSELGIDGTITINTPDIDFQKELEQLEQETFKTSSTALNLCLSQQNGRFSTVTFGGTGGLPQNPASNFTGSSSSLTGINSINSFANTNKLTPQNFYNQSRNIAPANTLVKTKDGKTLLVAKSQETKPVFCQS